jgi:hypothetical protein
MAVVWRGWDPRLEHEVAIKEPLFDASLDPEILHEMADRFLREAKTAAKLNHPGIVTIHAADVFEGRPFIVMELIEGITLSQALESGALPPETALPILDQLLDAAAYAHAKGVIHRDIKPDNVFLTNDGRVKLADFGIAHDNSASNKKTQVGTVLGTPGYMAPEQATGATIDNRTDLFAIGTVAYEMLTGSNPFGANDGIDATTLLYRIVHEPAPELPEVATAGLPADVRPAVLAALNKNPDDRPKDAASFKAMLHGLAAPKVVPGTGVGAYSGSPSVQSASASSAKWLPYAIVGGIGAVILAVILIMANGGGGGGGGVALMTPGAGQTPPEAAPSGQAAPASEEVPATSEPVAEELEPAAQEPEVDSAASDMSSPDYFMFPDSASKLIPKKAINALDAWGARVARNEIMARHGYVFSVNMKLADYFNGKDWYEPDATFEVTQSNFNKTEWKNITRIRAFEKKKGWLKKSFEEKMGWR